MAPRKCPTWAAAIGVAGLLLAVIVLIAVPIARKQIVGRERSYMVMVDAGSSSSKIYVFSWIAGRTKEETPEDIKQEFFKRTSRGGISHYASTPEKATEEIVEILKQNVLDPKPDGSPPLIPAAKKKRTPIYMGATAGMRLIKARDPEAFEKLISRIRADFAKLGLMVDNPERQIRVITGDEEALAGWISTNYLSDTLRKAGTDPKVPQAGTIGALDMGGASTQISFVTKEPLGLEVTDVSLYDHKLNVYQHSFLCFGMGSARNQMRAALWRKAGEPQTQGTQIPNPCAHPGDDKSVSASEFLVKPCFKATPGAPVPAKTVSFLFKGTGKYEECKSVIESIFPKDKCDFKRCSFNNIFQPELPPGKFVAFSSYYFAMKFFNVTNQKPTREDYRKMLNNYCKRQWSDVKKQYNSIPPSFLKGYCFDGVYIDLILKTLGVNDERWNDVIFTGKIGDRKMSWPLGYLLKESADIPAGKATYKVSAPVYQGLVSFFTILLLACVCLLVLFVVLRVRGHQYTPAGRTDEVA